MKRKRSFFVWALLLSLCIISLFAFTYFTYVENSFTTDFIIGIITILGVMVALISIYNLFTLPYINNHACDYDLTSFVNRDSEFDYVLSQVNRGIRTIYVSGSTGSGKTFFLSKLHDSILIKDKKLKLTSIYPLYIEIKKGEHIKEAIKKRINVKQDLNNKDLLKYIHKVSKSKILIIFIDNSNDYLYLQVIEQINALISLDNNIYFVIASNYLSEIYSPVTMNPFTIKEIKKIADIIEVSVNDATCYKILEMSAGLPILISLFLKQLKLTGDLTSICDAEIFIDEICKKFNNEQQKLITIIAYYTLANTDICFTTLNRHYRECTKKNIHHLNRSGLIEYSENIDKITIPEFFAEIIRELFAEMRFEIYNSLYLMLSQSKCDKSSCLIFLLLSDKQTLSFHELERKILELLDSKCYNFLINLYMLLKDFKMINKHYEEERIKKTLLFCYIHSLLEIGEYKKAKDYIDSSSIWSQLINLREINQSLDFDFNFDLADLDHFFGDFELAIESYRTLLLFNITDEQQVKCRWAIGHCYRHIGDMSSLYESLRYFEEIISNSTIANKFYFIRSYQSIVLIKLFLGDIDYQYDKGFREMLDFIGADNQIKRLEILTSRQYAIYHRIILHENEICLKILYDAIDILVLSGARIIYDYYFEVAETLRHIILNTNNNTHLSESKNYYQKSLEFAIKSGDISLKYISEIGLILLNIYEGNVTSKDIERIIEISNFCEDRNIIYIYNYAINIKEYLYGVLVEGYGSKEDQKTEILKMNLFIM